MSTPSEKSSPLTRRERWLQYATLLVMVIFTALGVYILYYPTELLITLFSVMTVVTLAMGFVVGLVAVYKS